MSEYQYSEFLAIDRPLDATDIAFARRHVAIHGQLVLPTAPVPAPQNPLPSVLPSPPHQST